MKTATPDSVTAGNTITYQLAVHNSGPSDAASAVVSDTLPAGIVPSSATWPGGTCTIVGQVVTCPIGTVTNGANVVVTIVAAVSTGLSAGPSTNTATITSPTADPSPSNNSSTFVSTVTRSAELVAAKTVSTPNLLAGNTLTYTLAVTNNGPSTADTTQLTDTLPVGMTLLSITPTAGTCNSSGNSLTCDAGTLSVGGTLSAVVVARVDADTVAGVLTNSVTASSATPDPTPVNNTASAPVTVAVAADLKVTKTPSSATVRAGDPLTWTVSVLNLGPSDAQTVSVVDALPVGFTLTSLTPSLGTCVGTTCTLPTLSAGSTATVIISGRVDSSVTATSVTNGALVSATTPDPSSANNSVSSPVAVTTMADVRVSKSASPASAVAGEAITWTVVVTNDGPSDALAVSMTDLLPTGITGTTVTTTAGTCTGSTCALGTIPAAGTVTITVTATIIADYANATIDNSASVTSTTLDANTTNNAAAVSTAVATNADISIVKSGPTTVVAGTAITWTLTVHNAGPSVASGVTIGDPVPEELSAFTANTTAGTCAGQVSCALGDIAPNTDVTITVNGTVGSGATGPLVNTANVASPTPDPDETDRVSTVTTAVTSSADLSVTKTVTPNPVRAGEQAAWTVTVANLGPSDAQAVSLVEALPSEVFTATLVPSQGTCNGGSCVFGAIRANTSATVIVRGLIDSAAAAGPIVNSATATSSTADPVAPNNTGSVTSDVSRAADLSILKTATPEPVRAGDSVTYTLAVTNAGPSTAESVVASDPVPVGVSFATLPSGCTEVASTVSCTVAVVPVGATLTFALVGTFDPTLALGSNVANTASVSAATPDPSTGNNTSTANSTVDTAADLSITKSVSPWPLVPGSPASYTIVVTNHGPSTARLTSITDDVPSEFRLLTAPPSCTGTTSLLCSVGDITAGASVTVTLAGTITPDATSAISNTATVSSSTFDPSPSDNAATIVTPVAPLADVVVTKSIIGSVVAGQPVRFQIMVRNDGPSTAASVNLSDTIESPLVYRSASSSVGSCSESGGVLSCALGDLPPGVESNIFISADLPSSAVGALSNTATAATATTESTTTNDESTVTATIETMANLTISKTVDANPLPAGSAAIYTITVFNNGPSDAVDVTMADAFDPFLTPTSVSDSDCSISGQDLTCVWPAVPSGTGKTVNVKTSVDSALPSGTRVDNKASVTSPTDPVGEKTATVTSNVLTQADLALSKRVSPASADAGSDVTYAIDVVNNGPAKASDAVIVDDLPVGIVPSRADFVPPTAGTCIITDQQVACTTSTVDVGDIVRVDVVATIDPTLPAGQILNTATVTSTTEDSTNSNNTGTAALTVTRSTDLSLVKTSATGLIVAGGTSTWSLIVTNNGPSTAEGVVVSDVLPAGTHFVSSSDPACVEAAGVVTCNLGVMNPTDRAFVDLVVRYDDDLAPASSVDNSATVSSATPDPSLADNSGRDSATVDTQADLEMVKTIDKSSVNAGESVVYTLTVTNHGPSAASALTITDTFSTDLATGTPIASTGTCGPIVLGLLTCNVASLASGASVTVQIPATVISTAVLGPLANTASVTSNTAEPTDPGSFSNSGSVTTTVTGQSNLSIKKAAVDPPFVAGTPATWKLTVTNDGPSQATSVVVTDAAPAGVTGWTATTSQGTCALPTCTLGSLDAGQSATITVTGVIDASYAGSDIANTATVASPTNPTIPAAATVTSPVVTSADVSLVKTALPTSVVAGQTISWQITVSNAGPSDAQAVRVTDSLPTNVAVSSITAPAGTCSGALVCDFGTIAANADRVITVTGTLDSDTSSTFVTNSAATTSSTNDPDTNDHVGQVATPITAQAILGVTKTSDISPFVPGQAVAWTITVTNTGPSTARFVELADALPETQLSGVALIPSQGTCDAIGTCLLGDLTSGSSATVAVTALMNADVTAATLANSVTIQSTTPHSSDPTATATTPVVPKADLHITKRGAPDPVVAGENVTWTIDVRNDGPSDAAGVVVTDNLPTSLLMIDQSTCTGPTSGVGVDNYACPRGIIPAGTSSSVTLVTKVPAFSLLSAAVNSASVTSPTLDPDVTDNAATAQVRVSTSADLSVVKTVNPTAVVAGSPVSWNIAVTNNGSSVARSVQVNDVLPAGITNVQVTPAQGTCTLTSSIDCNLTDIAPSTTVNVAVTADVLADYVAGSLDNTATASSLTPDPTPDNTDTVRASASALADLSVTKDGPVSAVAGSAITWTLTVANAGPSDAQDVSLDDALPGGVTFVSASTNQGSCIGSLHCELSTVHAGSPVTITVNGKVDANFLGGSITNQATISSTTPDLTMGDHVASKLTTVQAQADLRVTKVATPSPAVPGTPLTWVVTVHNAGPSVARTVDLTETLPSGIHNVVLVPGQGTCDVTGLCHLGDIGPGVDAVVTVGSIVDANLATALSNTAAVVSATTLINTADDSVTLVTPVTPKADVSITKTGPSGSVVPGSAVSWTIVVSNAGPSSARSVEVTDVLPAALQAGATATATDGSCGITAGTVTCNLGSLDPDTSVTITVAGVVLASLLDPSITNTATVTSPDDSTPLNNSSSARNVTTPDPDLDVAVTPSTAHVVAGQALSFTVTVHNAGVSDATGSVLTFVVPAGFTLVDAAGCIVASGIATCAPGTIIPGDTRTFLVTGLVGAGYLGSSMALTATATTTSTELYTVNNTATGTVQTTGDASLELTKVSNVAAAIFGDVVTYTVTLTNTGPSVAPNATVTDELPASLDVQTVNAPGATCATVSHTVSCVSPSLAVGDNLVVTVLAKVVATGSLTNTASAAASVSGIANRPTATAVVAVPKANRLRVTKTVSVAKARVNDVITYNISVTNDGPDPATDIVVDEPMATALALQSATTADGSFDRTAKQWNVGSMINGQTVHLVITAKVLSVGPITNVVTAHGTDVLPAQSTLKADATVEAALASPVKLPVSGADSIRLLLIACGALVIGVTLVFADRRRRRYRATHV